MKFTNEMMEQVYAIFGDCQIEFDNDGQIIIYTGMYDNPGPGDGNEEEEESVQPLGEPNSRTLER